MSCLFKHEKSVYYSEGRNELVILNDQFMNCRALTEWPLTFTACSLAATWGCIVTKHSWGIYVQKAGMERVRLCLHLILSLCMSCLQMIKAAAVRCLLPVCVLLFCLLNINLSGLLEVWMFCYIFDLRCYWQPYYSFLLFSILSSPLLISVCQSNSCSRQSSESCDTRSQLVCMCVLRVCLKP